MPFISNPTAGDVHVNTPLTNFGQKYLQNENSFVSLRAMPQIPVAHQSDLYYVFSREDFFRDEAKERADGTESAGSGFELSTNPYFARVYAFHKDVTDRQRANQDSQVRLDNSAAQFVSQKLLIRREALFLAAYFATGLWGTDLDVVGGSAGDGWNTATGDPIEQIRTAIRTVQGNTGLRPNRMLVSRDAWDAFLDNDAVLDRIKGGATVDLPATVMRRLAAQVLELDMVEVVESVVNSAVRGATENTGFAGTAEQCLIYYAPIGVDLDTPTAGAVFNWNGWMGATTAGMRIKRFRHEPVEGERIEGQMAMDHKLTAPELGYMLHNVL